MKKPKRPKLPPMPPNLGVMNYPLFEPIVDILDAIKRWEKGERPTKRDGSTLIELPPGVPDFYDRKP